MQRRRGHPRERLVPVVVAAVLVALAAYPPHDPVRVTAAVVAAGLAVSALRAADARARLAGQVAPLCIGILLLGASSAGVAAGSAARLGHPVPLEDIEARLRAERDAVPAPTTIVLDAGAPYRGGDDDPDVSLSAASVAD